MKKYLKKEVIGDCTLYLGDCKNIIPNIKEKFCIITDPPYGIDFVASQPGAKKFDKIKNDDKPFEPSFLFEYSKNIILWGGNNFSNKLDLGGWIVWDKRCSIEADKMMGSPFELAWVSDKSKFKIARIQHGGVKNADYKTGQGNKKAERFHPTQKPIDLMIFCIDIFKKTKLF